MYLKSTPNEGCIRRIQSGAGSGGFTLIEVLVALVILSVGLLGLAALQTTGMKYNQSAYEFSQATNAAYNILDRMRANYPTATTTTDYTTAFTAAPTNPGFSCDGTGNTCTGAQLAQYDIYQWKTDVAQTLPGGEGSVQLQMVNGFAQYTIELRWNDVQMWLNPSTGKYELRRVQNQTANFQLNAEL